MKTYSLIIAVFTLLMTVSCQNETQQQSAEPVNDSVENEIVNSSQAVESAVDSNKSYQNSNVEDTEVNKPETVSNHASNTKAKMDKKQAKEVGDKEEVIKTAEDLSSELNNEVNRQANPDNYNGVAEIESKSNVNLVPVFSEKDLNKYFVQVAIKVHKMSKSELGQIFPTNETIYVVQNEGLYKYCLGKFDTEAEAIAYKKDIDKKYNFKDSQVVTYKQAW